MQLPTFIRLENSLTEALKYYNSPQMRQYSFAGVHLLPNHPYKYIQRTYAPDGIEIEDYLVILRDLCGNELADLTPYFEVIRNFNDPDTGLPQLEWSLNAVDFDAGYQLVYLEINMGANGFVYSSPFMLTADRGEYTSRWDYRNKVTDTMLSTGLQLYFRQKKSTQELSNYNPINTGVPYTATSRLLKNERWNSDVVEINIIEEFKAIFLCREVYSLPANFDGKPIRTGLAEAIETPDLEADENFAEFEAIFGRNYAVTYDPDAENPIPPGPEPGNPSIFLVDARRVAGGMVRLVFTYVNFTPTELTYQYSFDAVNWVNYTSSPSSPKDIASPEGANFYRIYHYGTGVTSNVKQLLSLSIVVNNVVNIGVRQFSVGYTINGFEVPPGELLEFQSSNDGTLWNKVITTYDNANPKDIEVIPASPDMDRIRIKYKDITSNIFMLP